MDILVGLSINHALQKLNLADCGIDERILLESKPGELAHLNALLRVNNTLNIIDLRYNEISDAGAESLRDFLMSQDEEGIRFN